MIEYCKLPICKCAINVDFTHLKLTSLLISSLFPADCYRVAGDKTQTTSINSVENDFQASNGENIRATDLSPPKRKRFRTPIIKYEGPCIGFSLVGEQKKNLS